MDILKDKACIIENGSQFRKFKKLLKQAGIKHILPKEPHFPFYGAITKYSGNILLCVPNECLKNGTDGILDIGCSPLTIRQFESLMKGE